MKPFEVIATVSDRVATRACLEGFVERGVTILRINGAHVSGPEARALVAAVRRHVGRRADILIDLPGNKIRTANLPEPLVLEANRPFTLEARQFNYPGVLEYLRPGDDVLASDGRVRFTVGACDRERARFVPIYNGLLENNKGVHLVGKYPPLPFLFEHDHELIRTAKEAGVEYVGLSYVRHARDVVQARALLEGSGVDFICKIETREACEELDAILPLTSQILIDRGDLSSEIGLYQTPKMERAIAQRAAGLGVKTFMATQILYNMVQYPIPLMAELTALYDIARYADGLQLSDETAVGQYPFEVLDVVRQMRAAAAGGRPWRRSDGAGTVVWLTGRPGSGKTTLAKVLGTQLEACGERVVSIDGDEARSFTQGVVGYSKPEREINLRYVTFACQKAAETGAVVVVASLSPYEHLRQWARCSLPNYFEIYLDCPLDACKQRDPKGHYAKAVEGQMRDFVGIDMEYETPRTPDVVLDTSRASVESCAEQIMLALEKAGFLSEAGLNLPDLGA